MDQKDTIRIKSCLKQTQIKMKPDKKSPKDTKVWTYSKFLDLSQYPVLREIKWLVSLIFIEAAPKIPISLKRTFSGTGGKQAFFIGFILTLFFCLIINTIWTYFNGTLFQDVGNTENIQYFSNDYWNIILYSLICPLYVGLTCWLVVVVIKGWGDIKNFKENEVSEGDNPSHTKYGFMKAVFLGFLILTIAFAITTNYINDIRKLAEDENLYYWFFSEGKDGEFSLGALGVYYFLLNYSLLIVTLIALALFMAIYSMMMDVGKALESKKSIGSLDFPTLKTKLSAFTEAYILAKLLVALYIINVSIWIRSPLGENTTDTNIQISVIVLGMLGVFLISIPRYFVELQWYRLKNKSKGENDIDLDYEDLRPFWMNYVATIVDTVFIGGMLMGLMEYAY